MKKQQITNSRTGKIVFILAAIAAATAVILIAADAYSRSIKSSDKFIAMGTLVDISVSGKDSASARDEIKEQISAIEESCLSWRIKDSDVNRINSAAGEDISVSPDTAQWISEALDICEASEGAFDITIGRLSELWGFDEEKKAVPEQDQIDSAVETIGYKNVLVNDSSVKIGKDQKLDLGAIGKGIACDYAKTLLDGYNVKSAVISVGGSVLAYEKKAKIGIIDPNNTGSVMGTVSVKNKAVSTSGDYEKFFEQGGKKYHHILSTKNGYPVSTRLRSVTVISDSGLVSDALSTACFALGYAKSIELLEKYNSQAIFINSDNTVDVTPGIKGQFEITNNKIQRINLIFIMWPQ